MFEQVEIEDNNIIIIGSAPSVLEYNCGGIIDSFKEVVRINDFEIKGYEKYVGTKTTVWGRSNSNRTKDRDIDDSILVLFASPAWNFKTVKEKMKIYRNSDCVSINDSLHLEGELGLMGRSYRIGGKRGWPSTGLLIIYYFLKEYKTVYIHGFDFFKDVKGYPRHYYNNKEKMLPQTLRNHNGKEEEKWVIKKVKEKRINILSECL